MFTVTGPADLAVTWLAYPEAPAAPLQTVTTRRPRNTRYPPICPVGDPSAPGSDGGHNGAFCRSDVRLHCTADREGSGSVCMPERGLTVASAVGNDLYGLFYTGVGG